MNIGIKSVNDNSPINSSIMEVTEINRNLHREINDLDLDEHFTHFEDIYIGGIPYLAYEVSKNILNKLALTASNLYAKNLSSFVNNLYNKEKKDVYINQEDEIISKTLINKEL